MFYSKNHRPRQFFRSVLWFAAYGILGIGCGGFFPIGVLNPGISICFGQQSPADREKAVPRDFSQTIDELLESLVSDEFEQRERAVSALLQQGPAVLGRLSEMGLGYPREARERVAAVQREIERQHLIEKSKVFLLDTDSSNSHGLPGWRFFHEQIGGSRVSKQLYLELIKAQFQLAELIEAVDSAVKSSDRQDSDRQDIDGQNNDRRDNDRQDIDRTQRELIGALREQAVKLWPTMFRGAGVGIGDSAALMLGVMILDQTAPEEVSLLIHSSVQLGFFGYLKRAGYRNCLKTMIAGWIPKTQESLVPEVMRIAYDLELDVVLPIALKHLSPAFDKTTREHAIFCVAKFGGRSHVENLLLLHNDTTVVYEFDDTAGGIVVSRAAPPGLQLDGQSPHPHKLVRINDLAIAAAMLLLEEDPQLFFPRFTKELFFNRSLLVLAVDEEDAELRTAQMKAWAVERQDGAVDG